MSTSTAPQAPARDQAPAVLGMDTGERWVEVPIGLDAAARQEWLAALGQGLVSDEPEALETFLSTAAELAATSAEPPVWGRFILLPLTTSTSAAPVVTQVLAVPSLPGLPDNQPDGGSDPGGPTATASAGQQGGGAVLGPQIERLSAYVLADPDERGPHVYDTTELANGVRAVRSLAGIPLELPAAGSAGGTPAADGAVAALPLCAFHALQIGEWDLLASTWIGYDLATIQDAVTSVEQLLGTAELTSGPPGLLAPDAA